MSFNSFQFLIFFAVVVAFYFSIPQRFRWILLLGASYYFYMCWNTRYVVLIVVSTLSAYHSGIQMGKTKLRSKRRRYLLLSLLINLGLLFSFKYFNFFNDSFRSVFQHYNILYTIPALEVLLPVGISFYTFQVLSYSIDMYRGDGEPEKHLGIFALYVAFFPQLVAGPIERSTHLLPQFHKDKVFDYKRVTDGLKLMLWGFFKKVVIADRLALVVDRVYSEPTRYTGLPLVIATYFFAFQIYCDFSGYSDIAIGGAQVMGYDLMSNFRRPYFSRSVSEFWRRWHISLSSWFRDYLYIPLGGSRVGKPRLGLNLLVTFLVSGLWHGANWTFVIWGALHGSYLVLSTWTASLRGEISTILYLNKFPKVRELVRVMVTFHLVLFAWIFFRADSISDAYYILTHFFSGFELSALRGLGLDGGIGASITIGSIFLLEFVHMLQRNRSIRQSISEKNIWFRWLIYYGTVFAILIFGEFGSQEFVYFQF